jgi:hypothetical protein
MEQALPYLVSPGSIKTALERIRQAATPERVTGDFMSAKINLKGGTGKAIIPYLKKIGLVASDGSPTELYKRFRNVAIGGTAIAEAIKIGYRKLGEFHEYFYDLKDSELLALINQVTGAEANSGVSRLTLATFKNLKLFASFDSANDQVQSGMVLADELVEQPSPRPAAPPSPPANASGLGFNLAYTINLNLPATSDQAVFNAIFKSLKEHLLAEPE